MIPLGPQILAAIKSGLSATKGLAAARSAGVRIRDSTWYRTYGTIKASLDKQVGEMFEPLSRRPTQMTGLFPSSAKSGYVQYVHVMVRDRATGVVKARPYAIRTDTLISRANAVKRAEDAMRRATQEAPDRYDEIVLFGIYTATYMFTPK